MKITTLKKLLSGMLLMAATVFTAQAIPADPTPVTIKQPDGSLLTVRLCGDEFFHFYETLDGVPLVQTRTEGYCYARMQGGNLISTGVMAHQAALRSAAEATTAAKAVSIRAEFNTLARQARAEQMQWMESTLRRTAPLQRTGRQYDWKGNQTGLVILVQFSDVKFRENHPRELFDRQFNEVGFDFEEATGSVYDYYLAQSNGEFGLNMDVVGPVTMPKPLAYYGGNAGNSRNVNVQEMVEEAFRLADAEADFSKYDWDNDGYVDNVFLVYAGYDESCSGNSEDYIWAHQWATRQPVLCDGVYAQKYACAAEMFGWEQMGHTQLNGIGTPCHEMGHTLGLSDLYDVDYSGANHPENWSLMAGGGHLANGKMPSNLTAFERAQLGWLKLTELSEATSVVDMPSLSSGSEAYVIYNPACRSEFYVLENRQKEGFDSSQGGHGLLVFHIDFDRSVWDWNQPNDDVDHPRYLQIPAGGDYNNQATCPFPGTGKVKELTDYSHATATLYNANLDGQYKMHCAIKDITEKNGKISFNFSWEGQAELPDIVTFDVANRGSWAVDEAGMRFLSSKEAGLTMEPAGATPRQMQFVLSKQQEQTYLYSVHAAKFVNPDGSLSKEPKHPVTVQEQTDGSGIVAFEDGRVITITEGGKLEISLAAASDAGSKAKPTAATSDIFTVWTADRGGWAVNALGTRFLSSADAGLGTMVNPFRTQLQFRLVEVEGATYLYSVHAHKYVNSTCSLSATPRHPVVLTTLDDGTLFVQFDDTHIINIGGDKQLSVNDWKTVDEGNKVSFDLVPLNMTLATVHWDYTLDGKPYKSFDNYLERNVSLNPFLLDYVKPLSQSATEVGEGIQLSVELEVTEDLPFHKDAWTLLRAGHELACLAPSSSDLSCSGPYDWAAPADDRNLWNFSGDLAEGFTLRHKATNTVVGGEAGKWQPVRHPVVPTAFCLQAADEQYLTYDAATCSVASTANPVAAAAFESQSATFACDALFAACLRIPEGAVGKPAVADEVSVRSTMEKARKEFLDAKPESEVALACQYIDLCRSIEEGPRHRFAEGYYYLLADAGERFCALGGDGNAFSWSAWDKQVNQVCRLAEVNAEQDGYTILLPNQGQYLQTAEGGVAEEAAVVSITPDKVDGEAVFQSLAHHTLQMGEQTIYAGDVLAEAGALTADASGSVAGCWYLVPAKQMCMRTARCTTGGVGFASPCLPFAVRLPADCPEQTLFTAALQEDGAGIVLEAVEQIPALTGFICSKRDYSKTDEDFLFEIVDENLPALETCLKGSLQAIPAADFSGALLTSVRGKAGFSLKANTALPANTAYMETQTSFLPIDLETAAIREIQTDAAPTVVPVYDLSGRRIVKPQSGHLYISGGKKVLY